MIHLLRRHHYYVQTACDAAVTIVASLLRLINKAGAHQLVWLVLALPTLGISPHLSTLAPTVLQLPVMSLFWFSPTDAHKSSTREYNVANPPCPHHRIVARNHHCCCTPPLPSCVSLPPTSTNLDDCGASLTGPPSMSAVAFIRLYCVCCLITAIAATVDAQMWPRLRHQNDSPPPDNIAVCCCCCSCCHCLGGGRGQQLSPLFTSCIPLPPSLVDYQMSYADTVVVIFVVIASVIYLVLTSAPTPPAFHQRLHP